MIGPEGHVPDFKIPEAEGVAEVRGFQGTIFVHPGTIGTEAVIKNRMVNPAMRRGAQDQIQVSDTKIGSQHGEEDAEAQYPAKEEVP